MTTEQMNDYFEELEAVCLKNDNIAPRLFEEYGVNKGLRDENGKGVLTGLTNISKIVSSKIVDNQKIPCDGELWYRVKTAQHDKSNTQKHAHIIQKQQ